MKTEIWSEVLADPLYEVSTCGRIRSLRSGEQLKPWPNTHGYLMVTLTGNGKRNYQVHRLVAFAFIPRSGGDQVNHKDGNKTNNSVENLEWVTQAQNIRHAYATGLHLSGEASNFSKLSVDQVANILHLKGSLSQSQIGRLYGVTQAHVSRIHLGQVWRHTLDSESTMAETKL